MISCWKVNIFGIKSCGDNAGPENAKAVGGQRGVFRINLRYIYSCFVRKNAVTGTIPWVIFKNFLQLQLHYFVVLQGQM